jgi:hypothetical protein
LDARRYRVELPDITDEMLLEDIGRKRGAVLIKGASTCKKPLKS